MREQKDHRVRLQGRARLLARDLDLPVDDAAVLHVGREQTQRHLRDLGPGHRYAVAERCVRRCDQPVALVIERDGKDTAERFVFQIGDAGVDLEVLEQVEDFDRGARPDGELHVGMPLAIGRGEPRNHRQRGRDRGDPQPPGQAVAQRIDLLAHRAGVANDAAGPVEHALALRRETLEPRAAVHQQHAHLLFKLLHARRQGRLGHPTGLGSAAEVLLPRQGQNEVELVDHVEKRCFVSCLGQFQGESYAKTSGRNKGYLDRNILSVDLRHGIVPVLRRVQS